MAPTARASAKARVIRGRTPLVTMSLGFPRGAPFPFLLPRGIVGPLHVLRPKDAACYNLPSSQHLAGMAGQVPSELCFGFKVTDALTIKKSNAIELRNRSWLCPDYLRCLARHPGCQTFLYVNNRLDVNNRLEGNALANLRAMIEPVHVCQP
jgi:hypothetical protein